MTEELVTEEKVSCHMLGAIITACDEKDIDLEWVLETLPYDRAYIEKASNFIEWSALVEIANRMGTKLTEEEILELSEISYRFPSYKIWRLIGLVRFDLFHFYR